MTTDIKEMETRLGLLRAAIDAASAANNIISTLNSQGLTDYALIPVLYKQFLELGKERETIATRDTYNRSKFLFVMIAFYSPISILGVKIKAGLRQALADGIGINSPSVISNNIQNAIFYYNHYEDFRSDVTFIYNRLAAMLHPVLATE